MGSHANVVNTRLSDNTNENKLPWLNPDGSKVADEELRSISKTWTAKDWEIYLEWFETSRTESLVWPSEYDRISETQIESIFTHAQSDADHSTKERVSEILAELTPVQRTTIELIFWHSMSNGDVAKKLAISKSAVRETKKRALNRLKRVFEGPLPTSRYMRGDASSLLKGAVHDKGPVSLAEEILPKAG